MDMETDIVAKTTSELLEWFFVNETRGVWSRGWRTHLSLQNTLIVALFNSFEWLQDNLEFDRSMSHRFRCYCKHSISMDVNASNFPMHLRESLFITNQEGGECSSFPVVNTNDLSSFLNWNFPFVSYYYDEIEYVVLWKDGGGWVFRSKKPFIGKSDHAMIFAENHKEVSWKTTDAGYRWVSQSGTIDLQEYMVTSFSENRGKGRLYCDPGGVPYCPITGDRLVVEWSY